jgi:hypothetical protein
LSSYLAGIVLLLGGDNSLFHQGSNAGGALVGPSERNLPDPIALTHSSPDQEQLDNGVER